MKSKQCIGIGLVSMAFLALGAATALAQTGAGASAGAEVNAPAGAKAKVKADARVEAKMTQAKNKADKEIDRRVTALTALAARIGEMKHLSEADKTSLKSTVDAQISALNALKVKIDDATELETLKTDIKSITASYRIYMLIIPQIHIIVAADRMVNVVAQMTMLGVKLDARIATAKGAGKDTAKAEAALADFKVKIADAQAQATGAVSTVAQLKPDTGDEVAKKANQEALKKARGMLKVGREDLSAARKDFATIRSELGKFGVGIKGSATTTATTTVSQ